MRDQHSEQSHLPGRMRLAPSCTKSPLCFLISHVAHSILTPQCPNWLVCYFRTGSFGASSFSALGTYFWTWLGTSLGCLHFKFGVRDNWCCVCSMENGLQIEIHTAPEIDVRDFAGKWLHEDSDMWCAPDTTSYAPHTVHLWWCAGSGIYSLGGDHAHFVGTDPRHRGRPLPEHEADVGTPAQQCPVPDPTYRRPPSPAEFRLWSTVLQRYAWRASGGRTRTTSDWNRTESRGPTRRSLRRTAKT
jgi:hypothetical protein